MVVTRCVAESGGRGGDFEGGRGGEGRDFE